MTIPLPKKKTSDPSAFSGPSPVPGGGDETLSDTPLDQARPLWDHLEELRSRFIFSFFAVVAASAAAWFVAPLLLRHLAESVGPMVFLRPTEAFIVRLKTSGVLGVMIASPVWIFHAWRFVGVALTVSERRVVAGAVPFSILLFFAGACFAWFGVTPVGLKFLVAFGAEGMGLKPMISVGAALEFALWMSLGMGLLFQWPVIAGALASWGFLTAAMLREHRRHAVLAILVLAALLTPGPDVTSQFLLAAPTYLLYEISILLARALERKTS